MSLPLPGLDVPVINLQTGLMSQTWYDYFQSFRTGAWSTAWAPTFTMQTVGGTPITAAVSANGARFKYLEPWKTVLFSLDATISNVGVGNSGVFLFTLPITGLNASSVIAGGGLEAVTTLKGISMRGIDATHGGAIFSDNTSFVTGGNGTRPIFGGMYETA